MLKDITFKKENDIFYIAGQRDGQQEGETNTLIKVVKNLIIKMGLSDEQAADIGGVSVEFVKKVRREMKRKK